MGKLRLEIAMFLFVKQCVERHVCSFCCSMIHHVNLLITNWVFLFFSADLFVPGWFIEAFLYCMSV